MKHRYDHPHFSHSGGKRAQIDRVPENRLTQEARRLRAKRRFSQNFLINEAVLKGIADCMGLKSGETVLEIGPGCGFLTEQLLATGAEVTSVELDRYMCVYLQRKWPDQPNFHLVEGDFLRYDVAALPWPKVKIVGNLPYQITSKILFKLAGEIEDVHYPLRERIQQITVMVQKEVAERITAKPGQRAYNPLSIALQLWFDAKLEFLVPSRDFYPAPKVDSGVITLTPRQTPIAEIHDYKLFGKLVRTAFAQKRKTLRNALLNGSFASAAVLDRIFQATGVNPDLRAEALSIVAFGELANAFGADASQD